MPQTVRDVMTTGVVTCPTSATVVDAAKQMRDRDVGNVLVMDDSHLQGILTDRDIVVRCVAEGGDIAHAHLSDICSGDVATVQPDTDLQQAVQMMRERAVRRIPVVEGGRPVGILSIGDVAVERDPDSALSDISSASPNK